MKRNILLLVISLGTYLGSFGQNQLKSKDYSKVFPVIKVATDNSNNNINFENNDQPVYRHIAGDLYCYYGIDKGSYLSLLMKKQLPEGVTLEDLEDLAIENLLDNYNEHVEGHETDFGGIGITCGGEYEASFVIIPEMFDNMHNILGENLVFAIPSKEFLVFIDGKDPKAVKGLKEMVREIHADGGKLLSKQLFTYKGGEIGVFEE